MRIAIIGAGAAGCFAAANLPQAAGLEVIVFEKTGKVMQKVKVSGGGRCNVTHACPGIPDLLEGYPRGKQFLKKAFYQFGPEQVIQWFEKQGVMLKTEDDGRMFPVTDSSQTIIDCIWHEMMRNRVQVYYHKAVVKMELQHGQWLVRFADEGTFIADKVLVATGGYAKEEQYQWIRELGHSIQPPVPSLFTFNIPGNPITELMGVSVPNALIRISGTKVYQQGPLLITHWGLSGPVVLKTSAVAARELAGQRYQCSIAVNWTGLKDAEIQEIMQGQRDTAGKSFIAHKNPFELPKRLWEYLLKRSCISDSVRWGELTSSGRNKLTELLLRDSYQVHGKTTFKEEFVTCGGVSLHEIDPLTMQSRLAPGIYFGGEIMDVDGLTGGYNFQHAWTSGWLAARHMIGAAAVGT